MRRTGERLSINFSRVLLADAERHSAISSALGPKNAILDRVLIHTYIRSPRFVVKLLPLRAAQLFSVPGENSREPPSAKLPLIL